MKKLVRDNIIEIMKNNNQNPNYYIAKDNNEFYSFLKEKLNEEIKEFFEAESSEDKISEMGDVIEVLLAIIKFNKLDWEIIEEARLAKKDKNGGFDKQIILIKKVLN